MKKIPYGVIDYKKLVEENCIYVDKTMYLEKLENDKDTLIYLKPGRFGKSLFTSMMYYYYDINSSNLFETLFKGTYVYDNPTSNKNNYYVLKFDFSGISTEKYRDIKEYERIYNSTVISGLKLFNEHYNTNINILDASLTASEILDSFIVDFISLKLNKKLYVIIDEYDNFTNGILEGDTNLFKSVVSKNGFVKSFYAVIKKYVGLAGGIVDRFFATGICPVTLNSMTTGFNIATDISLEPKYNSMIGLTHDEVKNLFKELEISEEEQNNLFQVMLKNYDGYKFCKKTEERVFNATLVMYFLSKYVENHEIPEELYDNNIVINYGKVENLLKLQNNIFYKDIISDILDNNEIIGRLKTQFNLEEDFNRDDIISLLYYFGYLTINGTDDNYIVFRIPNKIMSDTYDNYFLKILKDIDVVIEDNELRECISEMADTGKIDKITEYVSEILESTSNRIFIKFDEKYIELIYKILLKDTLKFNTYIEYPCNLGFADIYIKSKENSLYDIMIEIKYIKKEDYNRKLFKNKYEEAKNELNKYSIDNRLDKDKLRKYIVIFSGSEVKLLEKVD